MALAAYPGLTPAHTGLSALGWRIAAYPGLIGSDRIALYLRSAIFPLLPLRGGSLGPRLRN